MIIIGYQGIGKSTYCAKEVQAIDLESSYFRDFQNNRPDCWAELYVKTAINLSGQGYDVFVSSHKEVREALVACSCVSFYKGFKFCAIVPSIGLKYDWIQRLQYRYDALPSSKNLAALENAKDRFEENIKEIADDIPDTFYIVDHPDKYDVFKFMEKIKAIMR